MERVKSIVCLLLLLQCMLVSFIGSAQSGGDIHWLRSGSTYVLEEDGNLVKYSLPEQDQQILLAHKNLVPPGETAPLEIKSFSFSDDEQKVLIYTNTKKVWRLETRGDYWLYDLQEQKLRELGKELPPSSLMFAKFSPDGSKVAFVSGNNIYAEDLTTHTLRQLTKDGSRKRINGTFDWAYEEEFFCRDGFRWSPDSKRIAFWQIDATNVNDYLLINHTDSIYPVVVPVEYPVAGNAPSPYKIGVVELETARLKWMDIPGDPAQHYVPRMEWAADPDELILQQLNRKQNESRLFLCNATSGQSRQIFSETDEAWIDILPSWDGKYSFGGWDWLNEGREFLWASEKDGWRHLYRISRDGKKETLITNGDYDVMELVAVDSAAGYLYFMASPDNATQKYLYRTRLNGKGKSERLTPEGQAGTHSYRVSPQSSAFAYHSFSNYYTKPVSEWVSLPDHAPLDGSSKVEQAMAQGDQAQSRLEFFRIRTAEGTEMDAWMAKPASFDPHKKYPVVFYVYTEPAGQTVVDRYGTGNNRLYKGNMADDGYIYISIDNRGTPAPKGRNWRKSIYRKVGKLNTDDQASAAKEILKLPYVDSSRVAVWGWSGGGSATLNLLFQYPEIYQTGISIAAVGNQLTYNNIYQERYMGLPQENLEDFVNGSPITHAAKLQGNLLYIHGTGDDNVHYNNAEQLINELIRCNKQFQVMPYPNRSHSISEGEGTYEHLSTLFTNYLKQHCPPGAAE